MKLLDKFWIRFNSRFITKDEFDNEYYESNSKNYLGKKTRSVIYLREAEPSKVPPVFHSWLHYLTDEVPVQGLGNFTWQKAYTPNMTGTSLAYSPLKGNERAEVSSDHHSWQPNQ